MRLLDGAWERPLCQSLGGRIAIEQLDHDVTIEDVEPHAGDAVTTHCSRCLVAVDPGGIHAHRRELLLPFAVFRRSP